MEIDFAQRSRPQLKLVSSLEPAAPPKPHDIVIEQAVLGALLMDNAMVASVSFLRPEHFFEPLHGEIFDVIQNSVAAGKAADPIALRARFIDSTQRVGNHTVAQYLGTLLGTVSNLPAVPEYARILVELAERRAAILAGEEL